MALKDQNPAALNQIQRIDWSVDWIEQLKGQVWGLIQNGGGGGGGSQNLQQVTDIGNTTTDSLNVTNPNGSYAILDAAYIEVAGPDPIGGYPFAGISCDANMSELFLADSVGNRAFIRNNGLSNTRTLYVPDENGTLGTREWVNSQKAIPNGIASLDGSGLVPVDQLPYSAIAYQGTWDATTTPPGPAGGTPTLADGSGTAGDFYFVSVAGTQDLGSGNITFDVGDIVIYSSTGVWQKVGTPIPTTQTVENRANGDYQLILTDNQKLLKFPFSVARNITVPLNATTPFPPGSRVDIMMMDNGQATFVGESGAVLIRSKGGNTKTNGKYTVVSIEKIDTDEWVLVGDLTS